MEKFLKLIFSYQEYEKDAELLKIKTETEDKYDSCLLSDEELGFAYGGRPETDSLVNITISFNTPNGVKQDIVLQENDTQVLTSSNGWINKSDIC